MSQTTIASDGLRDEQQDAVASTPPEGSQPPADQPQPTYPRQRDLAQAQRFVEHSQFAVVGEKVEPFTAQIKQESRRFFPDDHGIYDKADALQAMAIWRVDRMRAVTFVLFCLFALIAFERIAADSGPKTGEWFGFARLPLDSSAMSPSLIISLEILAVGAVLFIVRAIFRLLVFRLLEADVRVARGVLKAEHTRLVNECQHVGHDLSLIENAETWPDRAGKSAQVALWYAMRADYLDRYSTTCLWKIDTTFRHLEVGFTAAKAALSVLMLLGLLALLPPNAGDHVQTVVVSWSVFAVTAFIGWFLLDRRSNDFLSLIFSKESSARSHYFEAISAEIKNLATLAIQNMGRRH